MKKNYTAVVWGVCILALGVILLGNIFGWFNVDVFFDGWWTLFIIVPSLIGLLHKGNRSTSLVFLLAGLGLLAAEQSLITYDIFWQTLLAAIILIVGINLIISGLRKKNRTEPDTFIDSGNVEETPSNYYEFNAIFSGNEKRFDNIPFRGGKMNAIFGGVELDLRQAIIDKDVYVNATAIFGGVDLFLPPNVNCSLKGTSIFGGSDNKVPQHDTNSPTVYVDSIAVFGGVEIK